MSDKIKSTVKKPPTRYFFNETEKDESTDRKPDFSKNNSSEHFDGEVVHAKRWPLKNKLKFQKKKKDLIQIPLISRERYSRGEDVNESGVKTNFFKEKLKKHEVYVKFSEEQATRTEILHNEEDGYIVPDEGEGTEEYNQKQIAANVDITAATKHFNLSLDFGPYRAKYTRNGRHLLLAGKMGHVAAFDWVTKRLHCEMNVTEEITDLAWLHIETMFAIAQRNWVHFYDNQGVEIHCVKAMNRVTKLEFLPYHFLLCSGNDQGQLAWLDVSIGELASSYQSRLGPIRTMCQNPSNGVMCIGNSQGVVSMWSPGSREPLAKLLCHKMAVSALAVDPKGINLATCGMDKSIKIWDIRQLSGPTFEYRIRMPATEIAISQRGLMALAMGNVCEVYREPRYVNHAGPYLRETCVSNVTGMQFCPFEDVLGIGTRSGFSSFLTPGASYANFDAIEINPYQTKSQRREFEVHALLDKVPSELIALDPNRIGEVDVPTFKEKIDAKKKLLHLKPTIVDFKQKNKMKGKGGSVNAAKAKRIVKDATTRKFVAETKEIKNKIFNEHKVESADFIPLEQSSKPKVYDVLDRFKEKKRK